MFDASLWYFGSVDTFGLDQNLSRSFPSYRGSIGGINSGEIMFCSWAGFWLEAHMVRLYETVVSFVTEAHTDSRRSFNMEIMKR